MTCITIAILLTKRGDHHSLDCVHTVLSFVEDYAMDAFEDVFGDFDSVKAELGVDVAAHLGLEVVIGREAVHELAVGVAGTLHQGGVDLVRT